MPRPGRSCRSNTHSLTDQASERASGIAANTFNLQRRRRNCDNSPSSNYRRYRRHRSSCDISTLREEVFRKRQTRRRSIILSAKALLRNGLRDTIARETSSLAVIQAFFHWFRRPLAEWFERDLSWREGAEESRVELSTSSREVCVLSDNIFFSSSALPPSTRNLVT